MRVGRWLLSKEGEEGEWGGRNGSGEKKYEKLHLTQISTVDTNTMVVIESLPLVAHAFAKTDDVHSKKNLVR